MADNIIVNHGPIYGTNGWVNGHAPGSSRAAIDRGLQVVLKRCRFTRKGVLAEPMFFQCAPLDEFGWDTTFNWIDYDTVNGGQYSRRGGRMLRTLTLSSLAIDWEAPWAKNYGNKRERPMDNSDFYGMGVRPEKVARRLDKLVTQGTPIMLIVKNPDLYKRPDFQHIVTLRSVHLSEKAGEPDARYFELGITEYRAPKTPRRKYGARHPLPALVEVNSQGVAREVSAKGEEAKKGSVHQIGKAGKPATLRALSKHFYGSPKHWVWIRDKNGLDRPNGPFWKLTGDDPLTKLFEKRKRKNQPVRIVIPTPGNAKGRRAVGTLDDSVDVLGMDVVGSSLEEVDEF